MFVLMDLGTYIKELLYRYDCVIVPGFGAFLTQFQSARIEEDGHFLPPSKELSFNRQLQANDGILAHYVASAEKCSYEVALQKLRNFANHLSQKLTQESSFTIDEIGTFSLSKENKIVFDPIATINFNRSSFGLVPFHSPSIERQQATKVTPLKTLASKRENASIPWMRYAAIGLLAITIGGFSGLKIYEGKVANHNWEEKQKADTRLVNEIQEATFILNNPLPAMTVSVPKKPGKYHVVAGAFRFEENAEKKVRQLTEKGFPARRIGVNKYGLHQVVYKSFEERNEALKELRNIKSSENQDAWLLVQELP